MIIHNIVWYIHKYKYIYIESYSPGEFHWISLNSLELSFEPSQSTAYLQLNAALAPWGLGADCLALCSTGAVHLRRDLLEIDTTPGWGPVGAQHLGRLVVDVFFTEMFYRNEVFQRWSHIFDDIRYPISFLCFFSDLNWWNWSKQTVAETETATSTTDPRTWRHALGKL